MTQLTKGMYGHEFRSTSDLFGLRCSQMRGRDLTHNSGWYNKSGEKLGWGDLSDDDFETIALGLEEGDLFIVLSERASFWNFVERPGLIGSMAQTKPDIEAPGIDYVASEAMYVIAPCQVYVIDRYGDHEDNEETELRGFGRDNKGISAKYLKETSVKAMMATADVL